MIQRIIMPKSGIYMDDILLAEWHADEGSEVSVGDILCTIETDKVSAEIEAESVGFLHRLIEPGTPVPIGSTIGEVFSTREEYEARPGTENRDEAAETDRVDSIGHQATASTVTLASKAEQSPLARGRSGDRGVPISPRARALLRSQGLDFSEATDLSGTGPGGRIREEDVAAYLESRQGGAGLAPPVTERVPLAGVRGVTARRMWESLQAAAQLTSVLEVDVTPVISWRADQAAFGTPPGYSAIFVKILATALVHHPGLNARVTTEAIEVLGAVNVGVAIQTDRGLVVPVIRGADELTIDEIQTQLSGLVERASDGTLTAADMQDATFTLSNSGMYEVDVTTAILNPPQVGLLWLGRIAERPVVVDGELAVRPTVNLCLTFDHRAVDGAPAAEFLGTLKESVSHFPSSLSI